jgi:hypothetical protein
MSNQTDKPHAQPAASGTLAVKIVRAPKPENGDGEIAEARLT